MNTWLIRTSGSQYFQATELLFRVLTHADGQTSVDEIARRVAVETGRELLPNGVRWLLINRLVPGGLITLSPKWPAHPPTTGTAGHVAPSDSRPATSSKSRRLASWQAHKTEIERLKSLSFGRLPLKLAGRAVVVLVTIVLAYHYSVVTRLQAFSLENPLGYVGLVPIIFILLIAASAIESHREPNIHDRELDYIVGFPMLLAAVVLLLLVPRRLSPSFSLWRLDLLTLPLFVAGALSLVFGVRTAWRLRGAVIFLTLAWPFPYELLVKQWLPALAEATSAGLRWALQVLPVAQATHGGSLFFVDDQLQPFVGSGLASSASVNAIVGFLVVGLALASLTRGRAVAKTAWLLSGMALVWSLNLAQILLVLATGHLQGEEMTIQARDPHLGLVSFSLGIVAMMFTLRVFGLAFEASLSIERTPQDGRTGPPASMGPPALPGPAVRRARLALAIVVVAGICADIGNAGLSPFDGMAYDPGAARGQPFNEPTLPMPVGHSQR